LLKELALLLVFAFVLCLVITPWVIRLAQRLGAVDEPDQRKVHALPMPRLGGLAVYLGFVATVLITQPLTLPLLGLVLGATLIVLLGVWDDVRRISPRLKLAGQILAAATLIPFGIHVEFLTNPFGGIIYLGLWGIPLTVFWVVAVTNAVNLIDGLDGLAAGTALIASLTLAVVAFTLGNVPVVAVTLILAGAILGFLRYNFHPARVFLGDTGSMFLGFALATLAIMGLTKGATALSVIIPIMILGIPLTDTVFAILRRYRNKKPIFYPDKEHLHHRLLGAGLTHRGTVLVLYGVNLVLGGSAVLLTILSTEQAVLLLFIVATLLLTAANRAGVFGGAWQRSPGRPGKQALQDLD
jgi:UDP-GlcNAc:undecaprenyl-phosphate GlcNAc-1-phosphate transferase